MNDLVFNKSWTLQGFKRIHSIEKVEVLKNPKTDKIFFSALNQETGERVSGKVGSGEYMKDTMVSEVSDSESGETFFLLHTQGSGAAEVVNTL